MGNDWKIYEKIPQEDVPVRLLFADYTCYNFPIHWHEHIEIHYIVEGEGTLKCGNEEVFVQVGDCAVINANQTHQGIGGYVSYFCLIIPPFFLGSEHIVFQSCLHDSAVSALILQINEHLKGNTASDMMSVRGCTYLLMAHLMRHYTLVSFNESVYSKRIKRMNLIGQAVTYINEHYGSRMSTKQLADMVRLGAGYFCQVFKEIMGMSAIQYLNCRRVDNAEQMLKQTEMNIAEIAYCCGFEDADYFSRIFKKIKGQTPLSIRQIKVC